MEDMYSQDLIQQAQKLFPNENLSSSNIPESDLPRTREELELHMQLSYKQAIEIAEEEVIENVLANNKYNLTKKRVVEDITTIGIGATKTNFNKANGVLVEYVDPANLIYSYTNDPNFEDVYYVGEIKSLTLAEIKKQWPYLTDDELQKMTRFPGS